MIDFVISQLQNIYKKKMKKRAVKKGNKNNNGLLSTFCRMLPRNESGNGMSFQDMTS